MVAQNDSGNMAGTVIVNYNFSKSRSKNDSNLKSTSQSAQTVKNPLLSHLDSTNAIENNLDDEQDEFTEQVLVEGIIKSGYLYKKATNLRKDWLRRWFFIKDSKLYYIHKPSDLTEHSDIKAVLVSNLLLSTVKEISAKEFHVISPGQRKGASGGGVYELQTDSISDTKSWVQVIRQEILGSLTSSAIADHHNSSIACSSSFGKNYSKSNSQQTDNQYYITLQDGDVKRIHEINPKCADWVSINLCITICIECSGIHRSLGTHISKVRSLTLDKWTPNALNLLLQFGNENANKFWEEKEISYTRGEGNQLISRPIREYFITQKYVHRAYTDVLLEQSEADLLLLEACQNGNLYNVYTALCNNANTISKTLDTLQTPLHICCLENYTLCAELICIWNIHANLFEEIDAEGNTAENIASDRKFTELCTLINAYKNRS